ncbi:GNAT family N-acetyltransferase [Nesterenkonia alba]|uniref:GNAT family N-acetyltransferase n=1 Tax=Nesterenkonia alba TaxID=515814 RepID=UPI0003B56D74|nr:GNAT family protein [Nesterenkonia alba]
MSDYQKLRQWAAGLFEGERVSLRAIEDQDIETFCDWWDDPEITLFNEGTIVRRPREVNREMFRQWAANKDDSGFAYAAEAAGQLVGQVSVYSIKAPAMIGKLGIVVGPQFQDRGYGTDILEVALRIAFTEYACRKLELLVFSYSDRGIHTYEKVGFQVEGRRRGNVFHAGTWYDDVSMGITAEEYFARHPRPF